MGKQSKIKITIPPVNIDPIKLGFVVFLGVWGLNGALDYEKFFFLHNFNLIIHEAGHVVFMFWESSFIFGRDSFTVNCTDRGNYQFLFAARILQ